MRVLITGLGSFWGSRLAQRLEQEPAIDLLVGVDTREPRLPLEKTEFVRTDESYSILPRIAKATQVDTVLCLHLVTDSSAVSGRLIHELNVISTHNLLAAAGATDSPVRKIVVKGSTNVYGSNYDDPFWWREDMTRKQPPRNRVERSLAEAGALVTEFAEDERRVLVTRLRFADTLGAQLESPLARLLEMPVVPEVAGFDPRVQFVHEDDAIDALAHATITHVPGVFNVAGDGTLPWSEVCAIVGKRRFPLPPLLTGMVSEPLRSLGVPLTAEVVSMLRYGRAVDNSSFQRSGFRYHYSTATAVDAFAQALRVRSTMGQQKPEYEYERDVEAFFRHSPAVVRGNGD
jgi:UDP-glucose 4-epimerase